jgi:multiple sugar transport system permease protein
MGKRLPQLIFHGFAIGVAIVFLLPLFWAIMLSLRDLRLSPPMAWEWLSLPLSWQNYETVFKLVPLGRYALNSLFIVSVAVPITLVVASWAGYAISQLTHREQRAFWAFTVLLRLTPVTALWLSRFVLFRYLGVLDSYAALIAPALAGTNPLFVLYFYATFANIPKEMFESARLEGAGAMSIWRYIALPLAQPTVIAVGVMAALHYWGDFINPLLYVSSERLLTLTIGLSLLQQLERSFLPLIMVGVVTLMMPALVLFVMSQRYFVAMAGLRRI